MARGHQKIQSQQKAQEKAAKIKKQEGHSASDQKKSAAAALKASCAVCKVNFSFHPYSVQLSRELRYPPPQNFEIVRIAFCYLINTSIFFF